MAITTYNNSDYSALFKRMYGEYGDNLYGSGVEDVGESQIPKYFDFQGDSYRFPIKVGFGGSVGFASLPTPNPSKNVEVVLTRKKAYARMQLDRETIVASKGKQGAFRAATQEETEAKLKSFNRIQACALYNDGTGTLGTHSGNFGGSAASPTATILTTGLYGFRPAYFEVGDTVEVVASGTTLQASKFAIASVNTTTRVVTLTRLTGSVDLTAIGAGTHEIVLEGSWDASPMGFLGAFNFTSGSLYSVPYQTRFASYINTLSTATTISVDLLNKATLQMWSLSGETPDVIIPSVLQMERLMNHLEDKKRYSVSPTSMTSKENKLTTKALASFSGVELMTIKGAVPVMPSRYVRDDMVIFANFKKTARRHAEKFGWFDEDGNVLMKLEGFDAFEARYGGYYENFINPLFQGFISNLA